MSDLIYQNYLGLETGDLIRTSYGTEGIVKLIGKPRYVSYAFFHVFVYPQPIVSILFEGGGNLTGVCYRDGIWQSNHGRDQYEIIKPETRPDMRVDMFDSYLSPVDEPYRFQDGVDYNCQYVWRCDPCGIDYNHGKDGHCTLNHIFKAGNDCPVCGGWQNKRVFWMGSESFQKHNQLIAYLSKDS